MNKFETASLQRGRLQVGGPFDDAEERVKHLVFMLVQGDEAVDAHADWTRTNWSGSVEAPGLNPGPAQAVAVAVVRGKGSPAGYEIVTWGHEVTITDG